MGVRRGGVRRGGACCGCAVVRCAVVRCAVVGRDAGNLYPNSGFYWEKVEIPSHAVRKSLPKQRKIGEKGRESRCRLPCNLEDPSRNSAFSIRVCCLHIERKLKKCQRKKRKAA